jgi:hypothetical protein
MGSEEQKKDDEEKADDTIWVGRKTQTSNTMPMPELELCRVILYFRMGGAA